jgi:hypothetical protein
MGHADVGRLQTTRLWPALSTATFYRVLTSDRRGYTHGVGGRSMKAGTPAPPLTVPKGKRAPAGWAEKIAEAIKAREEAKEARRGRPVVFPHSFSKR